MSTDAQALADALMVQLKAASTVDAEVIRELKDDE